MQPRHKRSHYYCH